MLVRRYGGWKRPVLPLQRLEGSHFMSLPDIVIDEDALIVVSDSQIRDMGPDAAKALEASIKNKIESLGFRWIFERDANRPEIRIRVRKKEIPHV